MGKVSRTIIMEAPVEDVFMYYARPEHVAGHFPEEAKLFLSRLQKDGELER